MIWKGHSVDGISYRALLLDFYGTLVEEDDLLIGDIVRSIAASSPVSSDPSRIGREWQTRFRALCAQAYAAQFQTQRVIEIESLSGLLSAYRVPFEVAPLAEHLFAYWQAPTTYADAIRFIANLHVPICIVSNIDTHDLLAALRNTDWDFDHLVSSEDCRSYKPRPEMFARALAKLDCRADEVLHVGDSLTSDIAGARECGIDTAWINRPGRSLPPHAVAPTYMVSNLDDLMARL